jgi:uncharacterized membrane protein YoaK (UPF0700 family)
MTVLRDAWRTLVPERDGRHGPLAPVLLALTVVTGLIDAYSYLALGHVFVANMTGNVVFIAFSLVGAPQFSLIASLLALASFVAGALLGGRIGYRYTHRGQRLCAVLTAQSVLLAVGYLLTLFGPAGAAGQYVLIVLLGAAMGAQNAVARSLAVPDLTTTVLTMTITGVSADAGWLGGPGSRLGRRLTSALAMFLGALIGALLVLHVAASLALLVALVMVLGLTGAAVLLARSDRDWTRPA